jgi:peptidoglycan-associated lipoprotein
MPRVKITGKRQVRILVGDYITAAQTGFPGRHKANWLESGRADIIPSFPRCQMIMRTLLALLLASLLSACATSDDPSRTRQVAQSGNLKVHPGLLGQPVPAELQIPQTVAAREIDDTPIRMDEEGLRTQRSVYFDLNKADLKPDYDPIIAAHARYLARNPNARVRIEGHADERGSASYNQRLGLNRAQTVRATLLGYGADNHQIAVKSWGKSKPKLLGRDEEAWAENRRADVIYELEK